MDTILLTGVTGQVGSSLAPRLQEKGHRVLYLIRPGEDGAAGRLRSVLDVMREEDIAIEGDITQPNAGVSRAEMRRWKGRVDKVVHGAASVKFDQGDEAARINVQGTENMLALAEELEAKEFNYLSTAYVAGSADNFSESDFESARPRNAYELSKHRAEKLVRNRHGSVYRLGIVIGDSRTGYTKYFTGYYGYLSGFWRMLQGLRQKQGKGPGKLESYGIVFRPDGTLELPLRVSCSPTSTLNLVTSDWVSGTLACLLELPEKSQAYHIVNPRPPRVQWVIETSLRYMGITGIEYSQGLESEPASAPQKMLDRALGPYWPYVSHEPVFTGSNASRDLGVRYVEPPAVDERLLGTMMRYAKNCWANGHLGEL